MRLAPGEAATIRSAAVEAFGPDVVVRLFGSRVDDGRRGGDIDLHIEARSGNATIANEIRFRAALWRDLDEPQVDVVLLARGGEDRWIDRAAFRDGIVL